MIIINTFSVHGSLHYINHIISLNTSQKQTNKMALAKLVASDNIVIQTLNDFVVDSRDNIICN